MTLCIVVAIIILLVDKYQKSKIGTEEWLQKNESSPYMRAVKKQYIYTKLKPTQEELNAYKKNRRQGLGKEILIKIIRAKYYK